MVNQLTPCSTDDPSLILSTLLDWSNVIEYAADLRAEDQTKILLVSVDQPTLLS